MWPRTRNHHPYARCHREPLLIDPSGDASPLPLGLADVRDRGSHLSHLALELDNLVKQGKRAGCNLDFPSLDETTWHFLLVDCRCLFLLPYFTRHPAEALVGLGLVSHPTPLDEFIKAGGSAKCLTLRLDGEEAAPW